MTPLPTLRQLQFFVTLAQRKSFSRAAEDCLVSQSTLSSAIKELEKLLDAQLVDRSTRSFSLTPTGEDVARRGAQILAMTEDLATAAAERRPLEGPFHLGVIPTIAPFLLPRAAEPLRAAFPKLELYLREDLTENLAERLAAGKIDAALLAFPYEMPGVDMLHIADDPFFFAASPDHPLASRERVALSDLGAAGLLLLEDGHCLRAHAIDACRLQDPDVSAAYGATSLFTLTQMVQSGLGATLLPKMAVDAGLAASAGLTIAPFEEPAPLRRIGLAWRKGSGRRPEAERLAELFRAALA